MSLYRKYRPKDFPSLVGQNHINITLLNAIRNGGLAHAYLFSGPRGTGKTTTARLLAKAVNSSQMTEDGNFDNCEFAQEIDAGKLIDVIEIDAASNRGIDEIRDLREKINYSPTRAPNKVYIIDEVHMLTKEAFNALLKTLEEPPSFVYFVLATTEIQKVPETIISRCQRFDFKRINDQDIVGRLKFVAENEGIKFDEDALKIIAKQARGGMRDALTIMEQLIHSNKLEADYVQKMLGLSNHGGIEKIYQLMTDSNSLEAINTLKTMYQQGTDLVNFNKELLEFLRAEMILSLEQNNVNKLNWVLNAINHFQDAYEKQKYSYIPELPLEMAIIKASGVKENSSIEEVKKKSELKVAQSVEEAVQKPVEKPLGKAVQEVVQIKKTDVIEETAKVVPEPAAKVDLGNLTLEEILSRWSRAADRIQNPLAKRSLMAGKPVALDQDKLTLGFASNFNKEKLFVADILQMSELAIEEEFGVKLVLNGKIDNNLAKEVQDSFDQMQKKAEEERNRFNNPSNLINSALNVFGGEVIG